MCQAVMPQCYQWNQSAGATHYSTCTVGDMRDKAGLQVLSPDGKALNLLRL